MPTETFGNGPVVNLGHKILIDSTGYESGYFVYLRTDAVVPGSALHLSGPDLSRSSNGRGDEQRAAQSSRQTSSSDTNDDDDPDADDISTARSGSDASSPQDNDSRHQFQFTNFHFANFKGICDFKRIFVQQEVQGKKWRTC